ncbi:DapH/DapD/GlmU-related protein [Arthrobacter sp. LAPM80]|uniref:DapH/DapD/GlmU-related protein n=1 Tax=Arthrobacter sp. LAPM80 TaxID=3141788 RepID=UPI00398B0339
MVITGSHTIAGPAERAGRNYASPVVIGDGCWIGALAIILPGVTIGSGCVIAAGAAVAAGCEADGVYAGVPTRRKHGLDDAGNMLP